MAPDPSAPQHPMRRTGDAPLHGTHSQAMQRLQIGLTGLAAMVLLVGLANIFVDRAQQSEDRAVPEAAPTVVPTEREAPGRDPLADVGVVPDLPASASPEPSAPALEGADGAPRMVP